MDPIRPEELARAKARIKSDWLLGSETPRGQASTLGSLAVLGHLDLISSYLSRIESLTVENIMDVYNRILANKTFSCTEIEPES